MIFIQKTLLPLLLFAVIILPQQKNQRAHNFSATVPVSLAGMLTLGETDYKDIKPGIGGLALVEYFFPSYSPTIYGLRLSAGGFNLKGKETAKVPNEFKTDVIFLGGGFTAGYSFNDRFFPYVYGGISNLWFSPKDVSGARLENNRKNLYKKIAVSYEAEFGSRIALSEVISLFVSASFNFPQTDNLDDKALGSFNDFFYSGKFGITLSLFSKKDTDGDGIPDSDDPCPSNPEDYDGFEDDDGCPDYDNDGDGIPDKDDKCPDEPEDFDGFEDEDGCPDYDNDGDGILDKDDKCPDQPENFNGYEDEDGCPDILSNLQNLPDRDKDGIPDESDKCPDDPETFNGYEDEDGCPDEVSTVDADSANEIVLDGLDLFEYRGYDLKPTSFEKLDAIVKMLEIDPFIKWTIESHTDNFGDLDSLKLLSQQRAFTIVRYFIDKGLPSFMFKISFHGAEQPIANNNTLEGRLKNNRIVIKKRF